jgi:hypothetical protein
VVSIGHDPPGLVRQALTDTDKRRLIYRQTGNLRALQLLLVHSKIESAVGYLGNEFDDAIEIAEKIDV